MDRTFNTTGACNPEKHYMVDISSKLAEIKQLVDDGCYFTINRARQYGKTTTIHALKKCLSDQYIVISLDFQRIGNADFATEQSFTIAFTNYLIHTLKNKKSPIKGLDVSILDKLKDEVTNANQLPFTLSRLFPYIHDLCESADKEIVVIIDEVDSATNNQVFLDFLAQLRSDYLERDSISTFHSVILAGVYDVKNIKRKIRDDSDHKINSPWNIATDFKVDMSFSKDEICEMLDEYEADYYTGMNTDSIAQMIYDSTSGYPFLVSRLCQLIDRDIAGTEAFPDKSSAWTREGFLEADKKLLSEKNTLFESLIGKLTDYPELREMLYTTLFNGEKLLYNPDNAACSLGEMFGFIKNSNGVLAVSNRIFETRLYNYFISEEHLGNASYKAASQDKNQFIKDGDLDMKLILEKFVNHFDEIYGDKDNAFIEDYGRKFFLLYLKPIINGTGHYYIEAQTRDTTRTDVVIDYHGKQYVIEMKIWRGQKYHEDGEKQLVDYLNLLHLDNGYMLTFSFNKKKQKGITEIRRDGKILIEAIV